jgi:4-hydroxy-tetrahydrodipicolinate reductase
MVVKVAISGAAGRMGRRLLALSFADPDVEIVQAIEYAAHPLMGKVRAVAILDFGPNRRLPIHHIFQE